MANWPLFCCCYQMFFALTDKCFLLGVFDDDNDDVVVVDFVDDVVITQS